MVLFPNSVQFSRLVVSDSVTPWITARQASLSITNSQSSPKLMCIESVMPSNHPILCCPLLFLPSIFSSIRVFSNESALCIRWPNVGASASVLPMNIQDWFPLEWTGWISLQSKGLSRVFSNTTAQKHQYLQMCVFFLFITESCYSVCVSFVFSLLSHCSACRVLVRWPRTERGPWQRQCRVLTPFTCLSFPFTLRGGFTVHKILGWPSVFQHCECDLHGFWWEINAQPFSRSLLLYCRL